MIKEDIINRLWNESSLSKKEASKIIDELIGLLRDEIIQGNRLKISGFGVFDQLEKKRKIARNPGTGEAVKVKGGRTLKFRPCNHLIRLA